MYVDDIDDLEELEGLLGDGQERLDADPSNEQAGWDVEDITERIEQVKFDLFTELGSKACEAIE